MDTSMRSVGGGLLAGLGKGLQNRAERQHDDMMLMKKEAMEDARQLRQQQFLLQDREADRNERFAERTADISERAAERTAATQERAGERADRIADQTADRVSREKEARLNRESNERIANIRTKDSLASDRDRSLAEDRAWNRAVKRFTTKDTLDGEQTDWESVGKALDDAGYPNLAKEARGNFGGADQGADTGSTGSKDLDEYINTTKDAAKQLRAATRGAAPAATAAAPAAMPKPAGAGTKDSPYQATDQSHIDWFKANANPGDVISVNGKLYSK